MSSETSRNEPKSYDELLAELREVQRSTMPSWIYDWISTDETALAVKRRAVASADLGMLAVENALTEIDAKVGAPKLARPATQRNIVGINVVLGKIKAALVWQFLMLEKLLDMQRSGVPYCGAWKQGTYYPGMFVTWSGSLWHCNQQTDTKPGDGNPAWTLAVKKGRDGKDLR